MGQVFSAASKKEDNGDLLSSFTEYFKKIKTESKIISPETIRSIELHLKNGNIQRANSVIRDALKNIDNVPINIAVTGESGAGKSSFINALREVGDDERDAAEVGVIETTMKITSYKHPKIENLIIWDLPGVGTLNFPPKDYLKKVEFQKYDFFIIASATRFTKHEIDLAKAIKRMGKNYYFVRTKVDFDIDNEKKCKPRTFDREKILDQIRKSYEDTFSENEIPKPQIFLISNHNFSDYDFPNLVNILIKDLPAQKRHNFTLSLPNITEAAIQMKYNSSKQFIWLEALKEGALATIPALKSLSNSDVEKLEASLNHFRVLFGVDDKSVELIAKDCQVPVEKLKEKLKSHSLLTNKENETLGEKLLKCLETFLSVSGGFLATGLYFGKIFYFQFLFLDTVTEDAKVLLREAYLKE
ncbi:interferon-inducible GTPase 1-like [Microtus oregoni]|uniref:interferon-inducible GTPase 1-like n=1 Tax=Microtus oregoni TaxID=111838 RepID=UPI001BB2502A|nr:interferon-inducible GTPase 1-like [Microtus oregoni]XP_041503220.1 interferon-inducible GTPase 1-like [Microtus oregoni]